MNSPALHLITICMGSSCFCRGNNRNVELIQAFLKEANCTESCKLDGHLCQGMCKSGPNVDIDGEHFREVDPVSLIGLLNQRLSRGRQT